MRRRLLIAAIFLLAGAVVNVGVAWGCALWSPSTPGTSIGSNPQEDQAWFLDRAPPPPRTDWIAPHTRPDAGPGFELIDCFSVSLDPAASSALARAIRIRSGLPLVSLEGSRWWNAVYSSPRPRTWNRYLNAALEPPPELRPRYKRLLPLRPLWIGFTANSLSYGLLLWLLIAGPFALRRLLRLLRRRRGLCPACGYDLRHAEHEACPECGVTA